MISTTPIRRVFFPVLSRFIRASLNFTFFARYAPYRALVRGLIQLYVIMMRYLLKFKESSNDFLRVNHNFLFVARSTMNRSFVVPRIIFLYVSRLTFARVVEMTINNLRRFRDFLMASLNRDLFNRFRVTGHMLSNSFSFAAFPEVRFAFNDRLTYFFMASRLVMRYSTFSNRIVPALYFNSVILGRDRAFDIQASRSFMRLIRLRRCAYVTFIRFVNFFRYFRDFQRVIPFIMVTW